MSRVYIVTGANGHLGSTIVRMLIERGETVRGLLLPKEPFRETSGVEYIRGDVREATSLEPLFHDTCDVEVVLIHTAAIISIADKQTDDLFRVNVLGTENIVDMCLKHGVQKFVYVSSVHALPEAKKWVVQAEAERYSPDLVVGGYAKTKAEATRRVLAAVSRGLNATVVMPSGILGPGDMSSNHLVQFIMDTLRDKLPAGVRGGYDFVDVRDVALGCLAAADQGRVGECYLLTNRHYSLRELLSMVQFLHGGRRLPVMPMWAALAALPLLELYARLRGQRPLYTRYSLYTLASNARFSHDKATRELGYAPRDMLITLENMIAWAERVDPKIAAKHARAARVHRLKSNKTAASGKG